MSGGAIYINGDINLQKIFSNFTFINNSAKFGGAIRLDNYPQTLSDSNEQTSSENILMENIHFQGNTASEMGGAFYLSCYQVNVENSLEFGIRNITFSDNSAEYQGGALLIINEFCSFEINILLENVNFLENKVLKENGGALSVLSIAQNLRIQI